jgi:aminoglycoside phosphotransferase (APT) family kinase protein
MTREYRVLAALRDTDIPVPRVIVLCTDESILGSPFYVMDWVDGHVVRDQLPAAFPATAETRRDMAAVLVDTLTRLHAVVPDQVGLSDFGHPEGFLARQVRRWWQQWEASKTRELPAIEELHRRLEETLPVQSASGIVHGDYRLDNVMYAPDDPARIAAVLDWEMSTVGDPLCDLGLMMVYWADREDEPSAHMLQRHALTLDDGFYSRREMVDAYAQHSTRDLTALDWYAALGGYKVAIVLEGIQARFLMGMTVGEGFDGIGAAVPVIVEGALDAMQTFARRTGS